MLPRDSPLNLSHMPFALPPSPPSPQHKRVLPLSAGRPQLTRIFAKTEKSKKNIYKKPRRIHLLGTKTVAAVSL